jgi:hypothetical protein
MHTYPWVKKCLLVGIIFFIVDVSLIPIVDFHVTKASDSNDLIEVTVEPCGMKGFENTTIKLTRQQYQNLQDYLVAFRSRLNTTATCEEAVPIFKEAIVELDKYGLLPGGMSVERAQMFSTDSCFNQFASIYSEKVGSILRNQSVNTFCLVTGELNWSFSCHPYFVVLAYLSMGLGFISILPKLMLSFYLSLKEKIWFPNLIMLLYLICDLIYTPFFTLTDTIAFCIGLSNLGPQAIRNIVGIGIYDRSLKSYEGSTGWVTSYGLLGKKAYTGVLYGSLLALPIPFQWSLFIMDESLLPGMIGFTGLKITSGEYFENKYYLGGALAVGISSEPPG